MALTAVNAIYDEGDGTLTIQFDSDLRSSVDISTLGWSAVLPGGHEAIFISPGTADGNTLTFAVSVGDASADPPGVVYAGPLPAVALVASYDAVSGELVVIFDGEVETAASVSTLGWAAVLPAGNRAIFGAAGSASGNTLTFVVSQGDACDEPAGVSYSGRAAGYELFLSRGRQSDPVVDEPLCQVPDTLGSVTVGVAGMALARCGQYTVEVFAANLVGRSLEAPVAAFATDELAGPGIRPMPVGGIRVGVRAGGAVTVRWEYDEADPAAMADEFDVVSEPIGGGAETTVTVSCSAPQREYAAAMTLADGRYRARVISRLDGDGYEHVPGVEFAVDTAAPAGSIVGLTAA